MADKKSDATSCGSYPAPGCSALIALNFLATHGCLQSVPMRYREGLYIAGVRVNGKDWSFDYQAEGPTATDALIAVLCEAAKRYPIDAKPNAKVLAPPASGGSEQPFVGIRK